MIKKKPLTLESKACKQTLSQNIEGFYFMIEKVRGQHKI